MRSLRYITYGRAVWVPAIASKFLLLELLTLLLLWQISDRGTTYIAGGPRIVYIGYVLGNHKTDAIVISTVVAPLYTAALILERYFRRTNRLPGSEKRYTVILEYIAIAAGIIAAIAFIGLTIFDVFDWRRTHWTLVSTFAIFVSLSILCQTVEVLQIESENPRAKLLKASAMLKLFIVILAVGCVGGYVASVILCANTEYERCRLLDDGANSLSWAIAFIFNAYLFSLILDLEPTSTNSPKQMRSVQQKLARSSKTSLDSAIDWPSSRGSWDSDTKGSSWEMVGDNLKPQGTHALAARTTLDFSIGLLSPPLRAPSKLAASTGSRDRQRGGQTRSKVNTDSLSSLSTKGSDLPAPLRAPVRARYTCAAQPRWNDDDEVMSLISDKDYLLRSLRIQFHRSFDDRLSLALLAADTYGSPSAHSILARLDDDHIYPELARAGSPELAYDEQHGRRRGNGAQPGNESFPASGTSLRYSETIGNRHAGPGMRVSGRKSSRNPRHSSTSRSVHETAQSDTAPSSSPAHSRAAHSSGPLHRADASTSQMTLDQLVDSDNDSDASLGNANESPSTASRPQKTRSTAVLRREPPKVTIQSPLASPTPTSPQSAEAGLTRNNRQSHAPQTHEQALTEAMAAEDIQVLPSAPIAIASTMSDPQLSGDSLSTVPMTEDDSSYINSMSRSTSVTQRTQGDQKPPASVPQQDLRPPAAAESSPPLIEPPQNAQYPRARQRRRVNISALRPLTLLPILEPEQNVSPRSDSPIRPRPRSRSGSSPSLAPSVGKPRLDSRLSQEILAGSKYDVEHDDGKQFPSSRQHSRTSSQGSSQFADSSQEYSASRSRSHSRSKPDAEPIVFGKQVPPSLGLPAKSFLSIALSSQQSDQGDSNPFNRLYGALSSKEANAIQLSVYFPHSAKPSAPLKLSLKPDLIAEEVIGAGLWAYWKDGREPALDVDSDLDTDTAGWNLRMVEDDGMVDEDFPALDRMRPIAKFAFEDFAVVRASGNQQNQNKAAQATLSRRPSRIIARQVPVDAIAGERQKAALPDPAMSAASLQAYTMGASSAMGVPVYLRIRLPMVGRDSQTTTINVPSDMYLADVLELVCRKKGISKPAEWALAVADRELVVPLDRTVESLRGMHSLRLIRRSRSAAQATPKSRLGQLQNTNPSASIFKRLSESTQPRYVSATELTSTYKRYVLQRKLPMPLGRNERILSIDGDYIHILPSESKGATDKGRTASYHVGNVADCKQSKKASRSFKLVVWRAKEAKRYDFEAADSRQAADCVATINRLKTNHRAQAEARAEARARRQ
ncbi:uncharacterized protein L969DRAFT_91500 [Mixia osmundae IAM 14324]|uniref:Uncharacterized protein n=1 Tax=Mixia osmundae (strain CBS 9802 / IAM 14324 / JCM 22182 / KY 12970) TaxID=764103 RepID=G7DVD4_MIXOS|nr:uncharacterized protein L969DRAFT_91500 [Mixia osmundae IAM 14324]KEI42035.1 hypothetical protein L969DRAFT_91500 [Mixia osmundae IAM 14324]GAA94544.1 hypothetical protein E5Q_01196 [Mixia osmundae IAM 14324]